MKRGFYTIMAAQFFSSLADNALFVAAVELLRAGGATGWQQAALVPFLLAGVADASEPLALFQADGIHPNAQAQPQLLANVWPQLLPLLKKPGPAPAPGRRANPAAPPGR